MAISRRRAKAIHEFTGWAAVGTTVALALRVSVMPEDLGFDMITAMMMFSAGAMGLVWLMLPAVPKRRRKKKRGR